MRKIWKWTLLISLIFLFAVGAYFFVRILRATDLAAAWTRIRSLAPWQAVLILFLPLAFYGILGFRWFLILRIFKVKVPLLRLIEYHVSTTALTHLTNYFEPLAKYLRFELVRKHGISPATSVLALAVDLLAGRLTDTAARLVFLVSAGLAAYILRNSILQLFFIVNIAFIGLYFLPFINPRRIAGRLPPRWQQHPRLKSFLEDLGYRRGYVLNFFRSPALLLGTIACSAASLSIVLLEFFLIAKFLGHTFSLQQLLILQTIFAGSRLVPVPAGIGAVEAGLASGLYLIGLSSAEIAGLFPAMIVVIRSSEITWVCTGMGLLARRGLPWFKFLLQMFSKNGKTPQ